jgi:hypothetical protein
VSARVALWCRAGLVGAVVATLAGAAMAQGRRVYVGEEAEALKCAYIISQTAAVMERAEIIGTRDKEFVLLYAGYILQIYVSGTENQKLLALKAVADRRDLEQTLDEFEAQSDYCRKRFPIR